MTKFYLMSNFLNFMSFLFVTAGISIYIYHAYMDYNLAHPEIIPQNWKCYRIP